MEEIFQSNPTENQQPENEFKKPTLLVGKIGRFPKKIKTIPSTKFNENLNKNCEIPENKVVTSQIADKVTTESKSETTSLDETSAVQSTENSLSLNYSIPKWSSLPQSNNIPYGLEVLKNGTIIDTIDLMQRPFHVFGRLPDCDINMQHPTISRYHAVLQYRGTKTETDPPGFYLYDLGSTHGTFLNGKNRLKSKMFVPIRVGYIIKLGCSQRSYILVGPDDDQEEESELSITELKQLKVKKLIEQEEKRKQEEFEREERKRKEEEKGIDWGLGEDIEDVEDLTENPYAQTNNEELYLDDPKKALRGFFEREGFDLFYDCNEQGMGQFLCKVALPLDDEMGKPIIAEVLHRGKKKDAVVQCALEACRILDRFGVLRQATHESKKRKSRNWEENDYYDSDEDTFLDRTGAIEKKRERRMKVNEPEKAETYESLLEKETLIKKEISEKTNRLNTAQSASKNASNDDADDDEDSLDSYMKNLQDKKLDKHTISKLKFEIAKLKKDHEHITKLIDLTKPANFSSIKNPQTTNSKIAPITSYIGKKRKMLPKKWNPVASVQEPSNTAEEMDDDGNDNSILAEKNTQEKNVKEPQESNDCKKNKVSGQNSIDVELLSLIRDLFVIETFNNLEKELPLIKDDIKDHFGRILTLLKHFESNSNAKVVFTKKQKISKLVDNLKDSIEKNNLKDKTWIEHLMEKIENLIKEKCKGVTNIKQIRYANQSSDINDDTISKSDNSIKIKPKKKQSKEHGSKDEVRSEYKGNFNIEKYCMWVPPDDQAGDGKTNLNKKYGY